MKIEINSGNAGMRLDAFLVLEFPDKTRSYFQKLIDKARVKVNGKAAKNGVKLRNGDVLEVDIPKLKKISAKAQKISLKIIYEDDDIVVIDKPWNMVVHPSESGGHIEGTVVNALLHHCGKSLGGIAGELRPGIVHRLDKNTSGVLIVAKTDLAHQTLSKSFAERTVEKRYQTLVYGTVTPSEAVINSPIGRSFLNRKKMAISSEDKGRSAITQYKLKKVYSDRFGQYSFLDINLKTGRTHQIRVHMNAIGYPVVGDITYGKSDVNKHFATDYGLERQFLHARKVVIIHPRTNKKIAFESDLPDDLSKVLKSLS